MRVLGIDFGDKRIGLAVSDKLGFTAQGIGRYQVKNKKDDKKFFQELASKYDIQEVVIGLPLRMDGTEGARAEKTKEFASWLERILNLPITLWDERLTTQQASRILNQQKIKKKTKKDLKDQISAVIILASYLENERSKSHASQNH
jgi:putative Holliday junction resolvase